MYKATSSRWSPFHASDVFFSLVLICVTRVTVMVGAWSVLSISYLGVRPKKEGGLGCGPGGYTVAC
jgi:hypothetical protein